MSDLESSQDVPAESSRGQNVLCRRALFRGGIGLFGIGYAGAIGYPVYRYVNTPVENAAAAAAVTEVSLPDAHQLKPGSAMMFKFGTSPAILIHHRDGSWTSFNARCTHLGCTVQFEAEKNRIFCACHGGVYDPLSGDALAGPPPKGLSKLKVEVKDDAVVVARA